MQTTASIKAKAKSHPSHSNLARIPLQRKCACGSNATLTGQCDACNQDRLLGPQNNLDIDAPGDDYEREADLVADRVIRMPDPEKQIKHTPINQPRSAKSQESAKTNENPVKTQRVITPKHCSKDTGISRGVGNAFFRILLNVATCPLDNASAALLSTPGMNLARISRSILTHCVTNFRSKDSIP